MKDYDSFDSRFKFQYFLFDFKESSLFFFEIKKFLILNESKIVFGICINIYHTANHLQNTFININKELNEHLDE